MILYLHIPFCTSKCFYCTFNSESGLSYLISDYLNSMGKQLKYIQEHFRLDSAQMRTVYIGGGTPSLLNPIQVKTLFDLIHRYIDISRAQEVSIEANPETVTTEKACAWRDHGITRVSIGGQSFDEGVLAILGRTHSVRDIFSAYEIVRAQGFRNVNIDLISCIPSSNIQWESSLKKVISLAPEHISVYELSLDKDVFLARGGPSCLLDSMDEEEQIDIFCSTKQLLQANGFRHYEISNYAKPSFECQHNRGYWDAEEYIGLGAGAWSFLRDRRCVASSSIQEYIAQNNADRFAWEEYMPIDQKQKAWDHVLFGLRLVEGVQIAELEKRHGAAFVQHLKEKINVYTEKGYVEWDTKIVRLTMKGLLVHNEIAADLIEV